MRLLITGSDSMPGQAILDAFLREGMNAQGLPFQWAQQADCLNSLAEAAPDLILNAHQLSGVRQCEEDPEACRFHNVLVTQWLTDFAASRCIPMIQLSSCYVFDGTKRNPNKSASQPSPVNNYGRAKWQAEQIVRDAVPQSVILRLGWVIGDQPANVFERLLEAKREGKTVCFSDDHRGNPTAPDDVARVVVAMVKQILCDADVWGTYHYAGAEIVSQLAFARAAAEHFMETREVVELIKAATQEQVAELNEPQNASLGCVKIRNTFGIKQRPWRNYLGAYVEQRVKPQVTGWQDHNSMVKASVSS